MAKIQLAQEIVTITSTTTRQPRVHSCRRSAASATAEGGRRRCV